MKKLLSYVVITMVSAFVLVGCKEKEPEMPKVPEAPTNAPTPP